MKKKQSFFMTENGFILERLFYITFGFIIAIKGDIFSLLFFAVVFTMLIKLYVAYREGIKKQKRKVTIKDFEDDYLKNVS